MDCMNNIAGKKILLLCPSFFGYEKEIKSTLESHGGYVTYYNSDFSRFFDTLYSSLNHIHMPKKWMVQLFENMLYVKIKKDAKYDIVLLICGWAITGRICQKIRINLLSNEGKMILYYWDSLKLLQDDPIRRQYFDKIATFDYEDYKVNESFKFLPLFYCKDYYREDYSASINAVDILTISSFKFNRYVDIENLKKSNPDIAICSLMFTPRLQILFHKLLRRKYKNIELKKLIFSSLTKQEIIEQYSRSNAILDIPRAGQNGLTMRTFECLAMHKKLITTNTNIVNYDFYSPTNIFVLDMNSLELPDKSWFKSPFCIDDSIIQKYNLDTWLTILLS